MGVALSLDFQCFSARFTRRSRICLKMGKQGKFDKFLLELGEGEEAV